MDIRGQIVNKINLIPKDEYDYGQDVADQILAIKVEEDGDCFLCKYEARGALERIMKKPTEMCDKCHGTGIIPGRTLKQVLGEL